MTKIASKVASLVYQMIGPTQHPKEVSAEDGDRVISLTSVSATIKRIIKETEADREISPRILQVGFSRLIGRVKIFL
jgi:hypothetical protein